MKKKAAKKKKSSGSPKKKAAVGKVKSSPLSAVNKSIASAKKALAKGEKGASSRLDKAITRKVGIVKKQALATCKRSKSK